MPSVVRATRELVIDTKDAIIVPAGAPGVRADEPATIHTAWVRFFGAPVGEYIAGVEFVDVPILPGLEGCYEL